MSDDKGEKILASGWADSVKAANSSGSWVKFENGQIHMMNICGEPVYFEKVWEGEAKKRFRIEVYIPGEGKKTWEMSPGTMRRLNEEREEAAEAGKVDFAGAVYAIKRVGVGPKTEYRFRYQRQLTPAEVTERQAASSPTVGNGASNSKHSDDIPF